MIPVVNQPKVINTHKNNATTVATQTIDVQAALEQELESKLTNLVMEFTTKFEETKWGTDKRKQFLNFLWGGEIPGGENTGNVTTLFDNYKTDFCYAGGKGFLFTNRIKEYIFKSIKYDPDFIQKYDAINSAKTGYEMKRDAMLEFFFDQVGTKNGVLIFNRSLPRISPGDQFYVRLLLWSMGVGGKSADVEFYDQCKQKWVDSQHDESAFINSVSKKLVAELSPEFLKKYNQIAQLKMNDEDKKVRLISLLSERFIECESTVLTDEMDHTSIAGIFEFYGELNDYKDVAIKPTHLHKTFNELRARAKDISVKTEHLFVQTINKMLPLKIPEVVQSWSKILFGLRICVNSFADQYDNTNVILKDKFNGFLKTLQPKTELIDLDEWPEIIPYGFYSGVGELIPIGTEGRQILVNSKDDHTPIPAPAPPQFRHSAKEFARRFNSGNHYLLVTTDPLANPSDSLKDTDFKATAFKNRGAAILFRTMEKAAKSELNVGWVLNPNQLNRFGRKYMSNDQYLKIMFPYPSDQVLNLMLNIHENFNDSVNYVLIDGTMFADKQHIIDHPDFAKVSALAIKAKKPILILQKNEEGLLQVTPHDTIKSKSLNNGLNYIELLQ